MIIDPKCEHVYISKFKEKNSGQDSTFLFLPNTFNHAARLNVIHTTKNHTAVQYVHYIQRTFRQAKLLEFIVESVSTDTVFGSTGEDEGESSNSCLDVRVLVLGISRQLVHLSILETVVEEMIVYNV